MINTRNFLPFWNDREISFLRSCAALFFSNRCLSHLIEADVISFFLELVTIMTLLLSFSVALKNKLYIGKKAKVFLNGWKLGLFVNFGQIPCSGSGSRKAQCGSGSTTSVVDPHPDSTYHPDADLDSTCHILACRLQIDEDLDPVPDPAYHFDADPDFYLMRIRMRIQITKMMWIRIHKTD
jgi:hypothetical protein